MKIIDQILATPLTRKQFLTHIGIAGLALTGLPSLIKFLNEFSGSQHISGPAARNVYGGIRQTASVGLAEQYHGKTLVQ